MIDVGTVVTLLGFVRQRVDRLPLDSAIHDQRHVVLLEKIDVAGWIFTEEYLDYENEIAKWSGYPAIASVKHLVEISKESIKAEAEKMKRNLEIFL